MCRFFPLPRSIVVFSCTTLLVSVVLSTFFWLFASRLSVVPWHFAILGGLTAGILVVVTDRRVRATLPSATVLQWRVSPPVGPILLAWCTAGMLQVIFQETISDLALIGLMGVLSGLSFGLMYARQYLKHDYANVDQWRSLVRQCIVYAVQGLLWTLFALEVGLVLLSLVHLKAPCSTFDLVRRRQGCLVAFDQASYAWESQISADGSLVVTADAKGGIYVWVPDQRALVRRLEASGQRVSSLALSHDQQVVAAGFRDGSIRLWRMVDGSVLHTLIGHRDRVNDLQFSPDGQLIVSASDDRSARVWSLGLDRHMQTLAHPDHVSQIALLPDGRSLIAVYDDTILVWDVQQGAVTRKLVLPTWIVSMAVSPNGLIAAGLNDQTVRLWHPTQDVGHTLATFRDRVDVLAFSPDGAQLLTSASHKADVRIWQVADNTLLRTIAFDHHIEAARFTRQQLQLVTTGLDVVFVWHR